MNDLVSPKVARPGVRSVLDEPIDEYLCARIQEQLLASHAHVLAIADPFARRLALRELVGRLLVVDGIDPSRLPGVLRAISDRIGGLGQIEPLLRDPTVTEVMINGPHAVFIERDGRIEPTELRFDSEAAVRHLIERVVAPLGLRIDEAQPWVDARLPDGSRVHAIVPPLAVAGPTLTIRRPSRRLASIPQLVEVGMLDEAVATRLVASVHDRANILVSGGAGSGKTTLLRALCDAVDPAERIITIEDAAELALVRAHVVALEARPANCEGRGQVTIRDLVRQALRMRPDRIIVGEVRGGEVIDMLQAMNTGHDGSMSTIHANGPDDVVTRIEAMATMTEHGLPPEAVRRQTASAVDLIVALGRDQDGQRSVRAAGGVAVRGKRIVIEPW